MNRLSIILASLLMPAAAMTAQTTAEVPNRLLVTDQRGLYDAYVIDNIEALNFARVEGEVEAKIELFSHSMTMINLAVTRTESCRAYQISVFPKVLVDRMETVATAAAYMDMQGAQMYYEDFTNAEMTGMDLSYGTEYSIVTVAYDGYGCAAGMDRADFTTESAPITGNPHVDIEVVDTQLYQFTLSFSPNDDVDTYWCVAGEKGTMQAQYEMFAPMFGFSNMSEMIAMWGLACNGDEEKTWTGMSPNTEYEVFVAMTDEDNNFAPYQVFEVSTLAMGGTGDAWVDITPGDYVLADWEGEMKPSQFFTFTPNDQSSCYRFQVLLAENYDTDPEGYKTELCSDPGMPTAYWFFYEPYTTDYQINPNTEVVVIAAGKNINGVWGAVNELRFTTPAETNGTQSATRKRNVKPSKNTVEKGRVPVLKGSNSASIRLTDRNTIASKVK